MKQKLLLTLLLAALACIDIIAQGVPEQTSPPIIRMRYITDPPDFDHIICYDWYSIEFVNTDEDDVMVCYRYQYTDEWEGTEYSSDWKDFMPEWNAIVLQESAWGWVEVYAKAENKLPSDTVKQYFYYNRYPSGHYQRYYDFNVDGNYYLILDESTVAVSRQTVDNTVDFDAFTGQIVSSDEGWYCGIEMQGSSANPSYFEDVVIPATVDHKGKTYTVTAISDYAFESCDLTSLQLPNTLTSIGKCAFWCSRISNLTIPDGITSIGNGAFAHFQELTDVTIPESCKTIGNGAFAYLHELTDVTIPASCDTIGDCAFIWCDNLSNVTLPEGLTFIGHDAFGQCMSLTEIDIPSTVNYIGCTAFDCCFGLTTITCRAVVPPEADMSFYSSGDGLPGNIYEDATLFVPNESVDDYRNHPEWGMFYRIVPFIGAGPGDVDGDGRIDISDVTNLIDQVLSGQAPAYCDVDGDGKVNISDLTVLIDMILGAN